LSWFGGFFYGCFGWLLWFAFASGFFRAGGFSRRVFGWSRWSRRRCRLRFRRGRFRVFVGSRRWFARFVFRGFVVRRWSRFFRSAFVGFGFCRVRVRRWLWLGCFCFVRLSGWLASVVAVFAVLRWLRFWFVGFGCFRGWSWRSGRRLSVRFAFASGFLVWFLGRVFGFVRWRLSFCSGFVVLGLRFVYVFLARRIFLSASFENENGKLKFQLAVFACAEVPFFHFLPLFQLPSRFSFASVPYLRG
jgi:hypothetical protein